MNENIKSEKNKENHNVNKHDSCSCCHHHQLNFSHEHIDEKEENKGFFLKLVSAFGFLLCAIAIGFFNLNFYFFDSRTLSILFYFVSFMLCGRSVVLGAVRKIAKKDFFDEKLLMSIASIGALCLGEYAEAVAVMLFYQIGEFFQNSAVEKSKKSIKSLMEIKPDKANVVRNGNISIVNAGEVQVSEVIVVKPGERIPVDGIILNGHSFVNNCALTGESVPLEVFEGSQVFSGSINGNSVLEIKCTKIAIESAASRIISLVKDSYEKKARTEHFITRFSKVWTPLVCLVAILTAFVPPVVQGIFGFGVESSVIGIENFKNWNWAEWIGRSLNFLVVSCPCAIVLSVPLAFFGGIGRASKNGILIKGSSVIENLSKIKTCVFDKTGTVTKGVFNVTAVYPSEKNGISSDELLKIASHAEFFSEHPVSKSLKAAHNAECCKQISITDFEEILGHGIKAKVDGKNVLCGNLRFIESCKILNDEVNSASETEGTVLHVAVDGLYFGKIIISDELKDDAKDCISDLRKIGVQKLVLLSGDNEKSVKNVSGQLKMDEEYFELLPQDKVQKLETVLNENIIKKGKSSGKVAFIGDGINDAPVIARADVGISMGALGSDAAIEASDVVVMNDELSNIPKAILISKKTMSIVKFNIAFAICVKFLIMILSGFGITNMWFAVFGDVGVSLIAVLNAMRMIR